MREFSRRRFVMTAGCLVAAGGLSACKKESGPQPIHYDREVCEICNMIISDPHFAAEARTPEGELHKFDDIGDAIHWMIRQDWYKAGKQPKEFWVMNMRDGKTWLDARKAWYLPKQISPMDYGYGAVAEKADGAVSFEEMKKAVIKRGLSSRCQCDDLAPDDKAGGNGDKK
jgi:nitrous oxide reductase accessory protein NosL